MRARLRRGGTDAPQFLELLYAGGDTPLRELVARLDGCSGAKAGEIVATAGLIRATCREVTRAQAERLLLAARANAKRVTAKRLGAVGPDGVWSDAAYAINYGVAEFGSAEPMAEIPYVIEAWAVPAIGMNLRMCVNRTPIAGSVRVARNKRDIDLFGCGLHHIVAKAPESAHFAICLNIITPYMPITSDGKEPDLTPFIGEITSGVSKVVHKARRPAGGNMPSQKDIVLENLERVIAAVSGDGEYRFNARQLFYALRPIVMNELDAELQIGNFTPNRLRSRQWGNPRHVSGAARLDYSSTPERDHYTRHPMVENYKRPEWCFNKLLYIEKEGANEILKEIGWLERHDCAIMSSKGFSTRAARDLIDKLAEHDEPIQVFCAHDADAAGTMIYQTLQEATRARGARKIQIINLGLEPWEATEMGLEVETVEAGKRRKPVADYAINGLEGDAWEDWLQTHRVELNAMTTPQLIAWLDTKMAEHGVGKLIPPEDVLTAELNQRVKGKVRATLTERILREAGLDRQVEEAVTAIKQPSAKALAKAIRRSFKQKSDRAWRDQIEAEAAKLTSKI